MNGLERVQFTADLLPGVQHFDCGSEPWELIVSEYLKAPANEPDSAVASTLLPNNHPHHARVWLYINQDGELVGFGALAKGNQRYPKPKDDPIPVSVLTYLAIDKRFHGKPEVPSEQRYATRILRSLIDEAKYTAVDRPLLILFVDESNEKAIRFYQRAGFAELHKPYKDKATGRLHKRMYLVLERDASDPAALL